MQQDCTPKEIRNAFVIKSKENHPDTKGGSSDVNSSKEFIQVMEAYQVLSKTHSRANYDQSLKGIHSVNFINRDIFYEPWKGSSSSTYTEDRPYYGVKGIKKFPKWKIVLACVTFCAFGIMLQTIAINKSVTFRREIMKERSMIYSENLRRAREDAEKYGNEEQFRRLKLRLKNSPYDDDVKPEV